MDKAQSESFAESLRLTVFPSAKLPGDEALWHRLTGRDPEVDETRRTEGLRRQVGPHGDGAELEIRVLPGRLDLRMRPLPSLAMEKPYLGPFEREAAAFIKLARPWLSDVGGDIVRVAFGGIVLYPAADRAEAHDLLASYVPSLKIADPEHAKEVLYRVNRPAESQYGAFNRLTTWSTVIRRVDVATSGAKVVRLSESYFLRLEFDHNTAADQTDPLERAIILPIFEALLVLALENASRGECP